MERIYRLVLKQYSSGNRYEEGRLVGEELGWLPLARVLMHYSHEIFRPSRKKKEIIVS